MLTNTEKALRQFGGDGVNIFRRELRRADKFATGFTANSIRFETAFKENDTVEICYFADESYIHILNGRPAGAKFPPSIFSRGGRRLNLWMGARGIPRNKSTDFLIRRKIAEDGIEPVDILTPAVEVIEPRLEKNITAAIGADLLAYGIQRAKTI